MGPLEGAVPIFVIILGDGKMEEVVPIFGINLGNR
jgi:hypothetical protein